MDHKLSVSEASSVRRRTFGELFLQFAGLSEEIVVKRSSKGAFMDRKLLLEHLREVDSLITDAVGQVAEQKRLAKESADDPLHRRRTESLLVTFEEIFKTHIQSRQRILEQLSRTQ